MKDLFLLDPSVVFLNHGSFGACPRPVFEAYQGFQRELERQPVEFLALDRRFPKLLDGARSQLAWYVGAAPGNLTFATNASSALNAVVRSLALEAGDEVLLGDAEYGGMELLWEFVTRRTGTVLVRRPFAELDPGPRTRVVFCSHIEWTSGRVNDVASLCARARTAGALSIVDGAHAPGQIDLDLETLGADVYAGNCHKWQLQIGKLVTSAWRRCSLATGKSPGPAFWSVTRRSGESLAQLAEKGCHVGADPLFGEETIFDAVELVTDVVDRAAGSGDALELALVGAAKAYAYGDFVLSCDEVVHLCFEVGERVSHEFEALPPGLASVERLLHLRVVDHDVRRHDSEQSFGVAGVECLD